MTDFESIQYGLKLGFWTILLVFLWALGKVHGWDKVIYYSGIKFIVRKFKPVKVGNGGRAETLPTGVLWAIGIYVAMYGLASQRYENKVDLLEYRYTAFLTTVAAGAPFMGARLKKIEDSSCQKKPEFFNPIALFQSLFWFHGTYPEFDGLLRRTVEEWKIKLKDAQLYKADLRETDLSGADLRGANLTGANLREAIFNGADLTGALLLLADLSGAKGIEYQQLITVGSLYEVKGISNDLLARLKKDKPNLFKWHP